MKSWVLLAWSTLFRCADTFGNYFNYVRTACLIVKAPVQVSWPHSMRVRGHASCTRQVFENPGLKRAKVAIRNSGQFGRRERLFIQQRVLVLLLGVVLRLLHVCIAGNRWKP